MATGCGHALDAGHVVVQQDHVGPGLGGAAVRRAGVAGLAHHLEARIAGQQRDQAAAEQAVVVVEAGGQSAELVVSPHLDPRSQIALAQPRQAGLQPRQRVEAKQLGRIQQGHRAADGQRQHQNWKTLSTTVSRESCCSMAETKPSMRAT